MNHIQRLQADNKELRNAITAIRERITETEAYYSSAKFDAPNDYAHVSTDVRHRLADLKRLAWETLI